LRKRDFWTQPNIDGVAYQDMNSWSEFIGFLDSEMTRYTTFIWRGQRKSEWLLESTLDRLLKLYGWLSREDLREKQLIDFKLATR